jgi:acetyl/propionyl-CoA carboxylase alpha subunit
LVKEQIKVARGEKLSFAQEDLKIIGHAVELRVYAEDPASGFLPDIGKLKSYRRPTGPGVRVDDGFQQGMDIPIYYDPMIAKLATHGKDRTEALQRMVRAIDEYDIVGIKNTLAFGKWVMQHEAFVSGNFDTHFIAQYFKPEMLDETKEDEALIAALVGIKVWEQQNKSNISNGTAQPTQGSQWKERRQLR